MTPAAVAGMLNVTGNKKRGRVFVVRKRKSGAETHIYAIHGKRVAVYVPKRFAGKGSKALSAAKKQGWKKQPRAAAGTASGGQWVKR